MSAAGDERRKRALTAEAAVSSVLAVDTATMWADDERALQTALTVLHRLASAGQR